MVDRNIIRWPGSKNTYPVLVTVGHLPAHCHDDKLWGWRYFGLLYVSLDVSPPSGGSRLWIYHPWGAINIDFYVNRRTT